MLPLSAAQYRPADHKARIMSTVSPSFAPAILKAAHKCGVSAETFAAFAYKIRPDYLPKDIPAIVKAFKRASVEVDTAIAKATPDTTAVVPAPPAPAPAPVVTQHKEAVQAIRAHRVPSLAAIASGVVDTVDAVGSVARAIRAGDESAGTMGRAEAAEAVRITAKELTDAGADPRKVAAMKWNLLARLAGAKRK